MNVHDPQPAAAKPLTFYGVELSSRLLLGTARYPSPQVMSQAVKAVARRHRHGVAAPRDGARRHRASGSST